MAELSLGLGIGALVVLIAVLAVRASVRLGLPSLLLYLGIGLLLGEAGFGILFSDAQLTQYLGIAALVVILAEGGLTTRWRNVRPALGLGIAMSTVAVAVSIGVTATGLHYLLDLEWRTALLWGAVVSSTDAAAVFSVLRGLGVHRRISGTLELESGLNDAPVYIAVVLLASPDPASWWTPALVVYELAVGAVVGIALGWIGSQALRRAALPATGLYPLATVAVCVLAYSAGQELHASGLLATYVAGLVLGNAKLPHRGDTLSFAEGLGWLAQIGLFVLLGLYASPGRLPSVIIPALITGAVLVLVARPLSVLAAALPFRVPWREQVFLSWSGLRGAVPIVLALIPVTRDFPGAQQLIDVVFVLVVVLTLVQGTTLPLVARMLGLVRRGEAQEIEVDSAPLDELGAELLQVRVPKGSKLHGVYISELRLPVGATVSLVVRDKAGFTPQPTTRVQVGDQLLIVATEEVRADAERRIRAIDRAGRYARWKGELGE
ncbi:potassium/proton antiporter [Allokutzneria sp. A3M-2-11 16]|uniref:potassium/proton antiporter n=1 Tax=Allokutzneria sp. A3M-2-11 16 TaxID=2962043 RepID=UPI0020B7F093|nr:potassium/proton antiporter [Allokutzneria sp. A3M-2-11 16]MCP3797745.1 potassium/proton antiporter [Allokutzneria sp. A3M-2-11 16]